MTLTFLVLFSPHWKAFPLLPLLHSPSVISSHKNQPKLRGCIGAAHQSAYPISALLLPEGTSEPCWMRGPWKSVNISYTTLWLSLPFPLFNCMRRVHKPRKANLYIWLHPARVLCLVLPIHWIYSFWLGTELITERMAHWEYAERSRHRGKLHRMLGVMWVDFILRLASSSSKLKDSVKKATAAASPGISLPFKPIERFEQYLQSLQHIALSAFRPISGFYGTFYPHVPTVSGMGWHLRTVNSTNLCCIGEWKGWKVSGEKDKLIKWVWDFWAPWSI